MERFREEIHTLGERVILLVKNFLASNKYDTVSFIKFFIQSFGRFKSEFYLDKLVRFSEDFQIYSR